MKQNRRTLITAAVAATVAGALPLSAFAQKKIVVGFSQIGAESELHEGCSYSGWH